MGARTIVQASVDGERKAEADAVLGRLGLSVGDVVELLIERIAAEGDLPIGLVNAPPEHDAWVAAEVRKALADEREAIPDASMEDHFSRRRDIARQRLARDGA